MYVQYIMQECTYIYIGQNARRERGNISYEKGNSS